MQAAKRHSGSHEPHQKKTSKEKTSKQKTSKQKPASKQHQKMFQLLSNPPGALSPSLPFAAGSNPKLQIRIIITRIPDLFPNRLLRR
jgi:hypothetical protein